jgi:hypothetical protein
MGFWKQRPSTAVVLIFKFAELIKSPLNSVLVWLLTQDGWMSKSWGWEIIQTCLEKADGMKLQSPPPSQINGNDKDKDDSKDETENNAPAEEMQVDQQHQNGESVPAGNERKDMLETIVNNVGECYNRQQSELDKAWLKEWFSMAVRKFGDDVNGLEPTETTGWVTEILDAAKKYRKQVA